MQGSKLAPNCPGSTLSKMKCPWDFLTAFALEQSRAKPSAIKQAISHRALSPGAPPPPPSSFRQHMPV